MSWKASLIEPSELQAAARPHALSFGRGPRRSETIRKQAELVTEPDRMFVVDDGGGASPASAAPTSFDLALPGGGSLPMPAITEVGVAPTYRRRGILRSLMAAVHRPGRRARRADRRADRQRGDDLPAVRLRRGHPLPALCRRSVRRRRDRAAGRRPRRPTEAAHGGSPLHLRRRRGPSGPARGVGAVLDPHARAS